MTSDRPEPRKLTYYMHYLPHAESGEEALRPCGGWPPDSKPIGMIDNSGFYMPIYDFFDVPERQWRATTAHLATEPHEMPEADAAAGMVLLAIPATGYPGISIAELVAAAWAWEQARPAAVTT